MSLNRDAIPDWPAYADQAGLTLQGRGTWRTTACELHGGSDSLRVNTRTGAWRCMACDAKGGDTIAHFMQVTGADFIAAAKLLGCWVEDGRPAPKVPRPFSARDALQVVGLELGVCVIVINDARCGLTPTSEDWQRFLQAAGRVEAIAREATT